MQKIVSPQDTILSVQEPSKKLKNVWKYGLWVYLKIPKPEFEWINYQIKMRVN